jgi:hypothetical protein
VAFDHIVPNPTRDWRLQCFQKQRFLIHLDDVVAQVRIENGRQATLDIYYVQITSSTTNESHDSLDKHSIFKAILDLSGTKKMCYTYISNPSIRVYEEGGCVMKQAQQGGLGQEPQLCQSNHRFHSFDGYEFFGIT